MEQKIDEFNQVKPRNPKIAFLLSLILPGLGQVYNGQPKKATLFFSLLLLFPFLFGFTRAVTFFYGLIFLLLIEILLRIYCLADSVLKARRQREYILKPYNKWYYHLLIGISMFILMALYDLGSVIKIQSFKISSSSNNPTFQVGDWIIADVAAYSNKEPEHGDVVVFSGKNDINYLFRVVGIPNDKIEIVDNSASINGQLCISTFIDEVNEEGLNHVKVNRYKEEFPNGNTHEVYKFEVPYDEAIANRKTIEIPQDKYYLLGDNRDFALDSRYTGFVDKKDILGRVVFSYWGNNIERINIDFRKIE